LNFFATFGSVLGLQITTDKFGSVEFFKSVAIVQWSFSNPSRGLLCTAGPSVKSSLSSTSC